MNTTLRIMRYFFYLTVLLLFGTVSITIFNAYMEDFDVPLLGQIITALVMVAFNLILLGAAFSLIKDIGRIDTKLEEFIEDLLDEIGE